jgi:hypothetical protein
MKKITDQILKGSNRHLAQLAAVNHTQGTLVTFAAFLAAIGRSETTGWRWAKAGWLHPINISGRNYLSCADINQFYRRAEAGEFAKPASGAAHGSHKKRAQRETAATRQRHNPNKSKGVIRTAKPSRS